MLITISLKCSATITYRVNTVYVDGQYYPLAKTEKTDVDRDLVVEHFQQAIRIATISNDYPAPVTPEPFLAFHQHLIDSFPAVHSFAERTIVNNYSLVYKFEGSQKDLKPVLFMGHMDVVLVDDETLANWTHEPFAGTVADDQIWGRGAIDDKSTVMALMEAMELSLKHGKQAKRTVYFSFGHDEEIGGSQGAKNVAAYFAEQGIKFEFVLDEGGLILVDQIEAVVSPIFCQPKQPLW